MFINGAEIGFAKPPYIVAEISGNHNGEFETAVDLIHTAKACGADAVKIQTFTPDSITINTNRPEFILKNGPWKGMTIYQLYEQTQTPREWHDNLFRLCRQIGITLFSSPFSRSDVDFLERFNPPAYKIASNEVLDSGLVSYIGSTARPTIMSMGGISDGSEITEAKEALGHKDFALLYCEAEYPATSFNFTKMDMLVPYTDITGFSDHSIGHEAAFMAVARDASIIEKHLTLDGKGIDGHFSSSPIDFKKMVDACHRAYNMVSESGHFSRPAGMFTRQYWTIAPVKAGEKITEDNVRSIRAPQGMGIEASENIYNCRASTDIAKHEPVTKACLLRAVA